MTIIKAIVDGEEREFEITGDSNTYNTATHVIGRNCDIRPISIGMHGTYLRLIRKQHTFCGVVLEETGERRPAVEGDWYFDGDMHNRPSPYGTWTAPMFRTILRPVTP